MSSLARFAIETPVLVRCAAIFAVLSGCQRCSSDEHSQDDTPSSDSDSKLPVDQDNDGVPAHDDCDDTNPAISPNVAEVCNDIDDDCDFLVDEEVSSMIFISKSGTESILSTGSATSPSSLSLAEDGTIEVCGHVFANLEISASISLIGTTQKYQSIIDGAQHDSVIRLTVGAVGDISNLTIQNGVASTCLFEDSFVAGGGICCESAMLDITDSIVNGNSASVGGGLYSENCSVNALRTEISSNVAASWGGGMALYGGETILTESLITTNSCDSLGGGMMLFYGAENVSLADSLVTSNTARTGGGVGFGPSTSLACVRSSSSDVEVGFVANEASDRGGAIFLSGEPVAVESEGCNWGTGATENVPDDIYSDEFGTIGDFGSAASFSCSYTVCE